MVLANSIREKRTLWVLEFRSFPTKQPVEALINNNHCCDQHVFAGTATIVGGSISVEWYRENIGVYTSSSGICPTWQSFRQFGITLFRGPQNRRRSHPKKQMGESDSLGDQQYVALGQTPIIDHCVPYYCVGYYPPILMVI